METVGGGEEGAEERVKVSKHPAGASVFCSQIGERKLINIAGIKRDNSCFLTLIG